MIKDEGLKICVAKNEAGSKTEGRQDETEFERTQEPGAKNQEPRFEVQGSRFKGCKNQDIGEARHEIKGFKVQNSRFKGCKNQDIREARQSVVQKSNF